MDGTIATIMIFAGNFNPRSWMLCQGQLLSISEYEPLFALIGTTYGGDGQTTFALPNLQSRIPVGAGNGAGLNAIALGQSAGSENVTLTQAQMPMHAHTMSATVGTNSANADGSKNPARILASTSVDVYLPLSGSTATSLAGANVAVGIQGNSQPISVVQPYQALNYVICVFGVFPTRP